MAKNNIIVGLDIGSGKVTGVAAAQDFETNTLRIETARSVPCKGLKGGVVLDIADVAYCAAQILSQIEKDCDKNIASLFLAVRGGHLDSFANHGTYNISHADKEITQEDMRLAVENAKSFPIKADSEIINIFPQAFSIDRQKGIINPEGMEGSLLEVDVHIATGSKTHLNNLLKALQKTGFRVDGRFYGLVPLTDVVLSQEEKEIGAMLVDLGGETMSVGIYLEGALRFSKDIPYGCDLITSDLARGLHTPRASAREIKEKYGMAFPAFADDVLEIPVPTLDGRNVNNIKRDILVEIIQPRVEELFEEVKKSLGRSNFKDFPVVGVLTGGGSVMPGMANVAANVLGLREVRLGLIPRDLVIADEEFFDPAYTTAISLLYYATERGLYEEFSKASFEQGSGLFSKIGKIFKGVDIFGS